MDRVHCFLGIALAAFVSGCQSTKNSAAGSAILEHNYPLAIELETRQIESGKLPRADLAEAYQNRGAAYLLSKQYPLAIDDLTHAIMTEDRSDFRINRAVAYRRNGEYDKAIAEYDEILRKTPDDPNLHTGRALALWSKGAIDDAIKEYDVVLVRHPTDTNYLFARCWLLAIKGRTEDALNDCNRMLMLRPGDFDGLNARAHAYMSARNYMLAIKDYDAALRGKPMASFALYGRGVARLAVGDVVGGNADVTTAKNIEPDIVNQFNEPSFGIIIGY